MARLAYLAYKPLDYSSMTRSICLYFVAVLWATTCLAQQEIPLYKGAIPNSKDVPNEEVKRPGDIVSTVSQPTLSVFLPPREKANGAAVIICPGGGYSVLVIKREGYDVAKAFTDRGITAFVLKYRLPSDKTMTDKSIGPLQDAQQAIKTVRERAAEWQINPQKIGIMGFSAGGHLASTVGTHYEKALIENPAQVKLRPDFMILVYPVISMGEKMGHAGSRANLLGQAASADQIALYSNETHVTPTTPPAFLTHAGDDKVVPVSNSLAFYETLQQHGVLADLHVYAQGGHGYAKTPAFDEWFGRCMHWLKQIEMVP